MYPIVVSVLCLVPSYYMAKSKGYDATWACVIAGAIGFLAPFILHYITEQPRLPFADITPALIVLYAVWLLPAKKDAPGHKYLKITFSCPECRETITFPRSREGTAELCPKCGEIVNVPEDEYSPKTIPRKQQKPRISEGSVFFNSYGNEMKAILMKNVLESNGVKTELVEGTGGGVLASLSGSEGFRIFIDIQDWDKAVAIEKEVGKEPNIGGPGKGQKKNLNNGF